ncbi:hypothetical protein [Kosakonia sp. R1.Fl]|uniref:hypothetical protein n=1 Tax=Kosakonia sp. R1.Fl TaxID=2928706 RepID=UPI00201DDF8A|nr:hypothetical protein [Kosakonia sp. R1.Fl]MCL6746884.1 hypothetical protein [Kosakonia sp. R1.Fl]
MIDLKDLFAKENVKDIIIFFAGLSKSIGYPHLDRYFVQYRFSAIETGEFMNTFHALSDQGIVSMGDKMSVIKGPNWKEPEFVTEKKYGIE